MNQTDDPIDILVQEHQEELAHLESLNSAAQNISVSGFSPEKFLEVSDSIRHINVEIRTHSEKEEKYLFPILERNNAFQLRAMVEEHRELRKVGLHIQECVEDIEEGRIYSTTVKELLQSAAQLYRLLGSHITKENQVLFPTVRKLLTPTDYDRLRESFASASSAQGI